MPRFRLFVFALVLLAGAACDQGGSSAAAPAARAPGAAASASAPVLLLSPEDLHTVALGDGGGPVVTGSIQPEKRADLRAEVSAVVTQVLKDNGDAVKRGELLMRLDDQAIRESLQSADASARAATQAVAQAERQVQRLKTLQGQGMTTLQALEEAEIRRISAQSELVAARSRVASAQQQLRRTEVRAPFDGVISERKASVGDTAQVGKELVKVIAPSSMRFEGLVSADRMQDVRAGQAVTLRVSGYPDVEFSGKVRRVDASANAATRQLEVLIDFDDAAAAPRVSGLYAEGRIGGGGSQLSIAEGAIVREAGRTYAWQVRDGRLARVVLQLDERDDRRGEFPVKSGLTAGDVILRHPDSALVDGQRVEFAKPRAAASAPVR